MVKHEHVCASVPFIAAGGTLCAGTIALATNAVHRRISSSLFQASVKNSNEVAISREEQLSAQHDLSNSQQH